MVLVKLCNYLLIKNNKYIIVLSYKFNKILEKYLWGRSYLVKFQTSYYKSATLPQNELDQRKERLFPKFVKVHIKDTGRKHPKIKLQCL